MPFHLTRSADSGVPLYTLFEDDQPRWQITLDVGAHSLNPFREEIVWESAGLAVIGGGSSVFFVDLQSGAVRHVIEVPSRFGHLALDAGETDVRPETLYVLTWTDAIAVERTLQTRWWLRGIAVDGVAFVTAEGPMVRLSVEMDPPGGWFDIDLDAMTGREIVRRPAFADGYQGLYS